MSEQEFRDWLQDETNNHRMTEAQMADLLAQKALFENSRREIVETFKSRIVGYVRGRRLVDSDLHTLLANAKRNFPGAMVYFEPVGSDLY